MHAGEVGLEIDYRVGTAEDLAAAGERFDVILNMEVIEHVADPKAFAATCASMLKPGGLMFVATLNRTLKSFGLAIIVCGICSRLAAQGHPPMGEIHHAA